LHQDGRFHGGFGKLEGAARGTGFKKTICASFNKGMFESDALWANGHNRHDDVCSGNRILKAGGCLYDRTEAFYQPMAVTPTRALIPLMIQG